MSYVDNETIEAKYLRLEKTVGGYSADTVNWFETYLVIKGVASCRCLELIESELLYFIEIEVEAFVLKNPP